MHIYVKSNYLNDLGADDKKGSKNVLRFITAEMPPRMWGEEQMDVQEHNDIFVTKQTSRLIKHFEMRKEKGIIGLDLMYSK